MASQKISQLTAITTVASGDYFPIVEASGTTNKRVEVGVLDARYYSVASGNLTYTLADAAGQLATTALASGNAAQNTANNALASGLIALQTSDIGVTVQGYDADTAKTDVAQTFTAPQRGNVSALTDGATITPDFSLANNFSITLGGNRTLANPTNAVAGQSGVIVITQDGTGSRTLAFGTNWKFAGGTDPTLTTAANAVDVLSYYCASSTVIIASLLGDAK